MRFLSPVRARQLRVRPAALPFWSLRSAANERVAQDPWSAARHGPNNEKRVPLGALIPARERPVTRAETEKAADARVTANAEGRLNFALAARSSR